MFCEPVPRDGRTLSAEHNSDINHPVKFRRRAGAKVAGYCGGEISMRSSV